MAGAKTDQRNQLYYGDNLDVLREHFPAACIDLVYLDPPFNSDRTYNVLFKDKSGDESKAQIEAFDDTWTWSHETESLYNELVNGGAPIAVQDALEAMRRLLGDNDVLAYLVMMAARLIELHRVLKEDGALYLHCDPTASHYLKLILDAIFGATNFVNEIIWKRTNARTVKGQWPRVHDVILVYRASDATGFRALKVPSGEARIPHTLITGEDGQKYQTSELTAPEVRAPTTDAGAPWRGFDPTPFGRHWANNLAAREEWDAAGLIHWPKKGGFPRRKADKPFVPTERMIPVGDVWTDVDRINQSAKERLGYPTQKPLALLERIIEASSDPGDIVLDPFAGCGTAVDASQKLGRRWCGIDVTTIAVDLIDARLRGTYGESIRETFRINGIPRDMAGAQALADHNKFEFERWCVMLVDGQPNEKQVGDKGIDGVIRFLIDAKGKTDRALISVKGGTTTGPADVRDLIGTVQSQKAAMGVFICMKKPTKAMIDAANHSGIYTHPADKKQYPKVQIITVEQLLNEENPKLPVTLLPYLQAQKRSSKGVGQVMMDYGETPGMFEIESP